MNMQRFLERLATLLPYGIGIYEIREEKLYPLYVNDKICQYLGFTVSEYASFITAKSPVFNMGRLQEILSYYERHENGEYEIETELQVERKDGSPLWVSVLAKKIIDGEHSYIYARVTDITGRKKELSEKHWQDEKFRILNDLTHAMSYDYDSGRDILSYYADFNHEGKVQERIVENYVKSVLGTPKSVIDTQSAAYIEAFKLAEQGQTHGFAEYKADYYGTGYHTYRTEWFKIFPTDGSSYHLVGLIENIEEELRLRHSAEFDALTELLNRFAVEEKVNAKLQIPANRIGAFGVCLDVDNFKLVNDIRGHVRGDKILRRIGLILQKSCGEKDLAGRIGGDEFFLFFSDIDKETVLKRCEKIEEKCQAISSDITVSMGVYALRGMEKSYLEIMDNADKALYYAKGSGKSRIEFYDTAGSYSRKPEQIRFDRLQSEYALLINSANVSVSRHLLDDHFTLAWATPYFYELFGYSPEEYEKLFHNRLDEFYRDHSDLWSKFFESVSTKLGEGANRYEYISEMPHKNGNLLWIKLIVNVIDEVIGGHKVFYIIMMDITDHIHLEQEQSVAYESIPALIAKFHVEKDGFRLIAANSRYYEYFDRRSVFPLGSDEKFSGLDRILPLHPLMRTGQPIDICFTPHVKDGETIHLRLKGKCIDWAEGDPIYLLIYEDITQLTVQQQLLEKKNRELEKIAYSDSITGGINRYYFEVVSEKMIGGSPAGSYAMVWLNLDKFKLINVSSGTEAGNQTLKYIYQKIKSHLKNNELVSRITADNFAIFIKNADKDQIVSRLENLAEDINGFNSDREYKYYLGFTAGVYVITDAKLEVTQIQDRANIARRRIGNIDSTAQCSVSFYSDAERDTLLFEKELENRMHNALANHHFVIYLQPKLNLRDGRIYGAEALIRWDEPDLGLLAPNDFIPLFEKNGFIVRLDLYVFEEVCRLIESWIKKGLKPLPISVNVSRVHFAKPDFIDSYVQIAKRYNVSPGLLDLEVTETVIFDNPGVFAGIIDRIHAQGFSCSMDDFGSGYSSLNLLKAINVDTLKLDRAFFTDPAMDDVKEREIVSAVLDLTKKLNIVSLAEGVETDSQREFLKNSGCDLIQGYIFSRPLAVSAFEDLAFASELPKGEIR